MSCGMFSCGHNMGDRRCEIGKTRRCVDVDEATQATQVSPSDSSDLLSVVKEIRKHDCGEWLKTDWEGACKRLELMALLEKLYKAAGLNI